MKYPAHPIKNDNRYGTALEYCGYARKRIVLRFCGEFIGSYINWIDAVMSAVAHADKRISDKITN